MAGEPGAEGLAQRIGRAVSPNQRIEFRAGQRSLGLQPFEESCVPRIGSDISEPRLESPD